MACDLRGGLVLIVAVLQCAVGLQPKEVCLLQVEEGTCNDDIQRYYYNTITQQCEEFSYSGCEGNANNFKSFLECQKTCFRIPTMPVICKDILDKGNCLASIPRYYYNSATKTCEEFIYTGCGGSNNNFISKQSCMGVCGKNGSKHRALLKSL